MRCGRESKDPPPGFVCILFPVCLSFARPARPDGPSPPQQRAAFPAPHTTGLVLIVVGSLSSRGVLEPGPSCPPPGFPFSDRLGAGTHCKPEGLEPSQPQAVRGMQQACSKRVWGTHMLTACAGLSSLHIFGLHLAGPLTDKRTGGQGWGGPPRGQRAFASLSPTSFPASAFSPHLRGPSGRPTAACKPRAEIQPTGHRRSL